MKTLRLAGITLLAFLTIGFVSCSKNDDKDDNGNNLNNNSSNLAGTTWVGYYSEKKDEGPALKFMSDNIVVWIDWEGSGVDYEEDIEETCTYEYTAPNGVITHLDNQSSTFVINGSTMTWYCSPKGKIWTLKRQ